LFVAKANESGDDVDMAIAEFHGQSYLELPLRRRVAKKLQFEIWLLAKQPDGKLTFCFHRNKGINYFHFVFAFHITVTSRLALRVVFCSFCACCFSRLKLFFKSLTNIIGVSGLAN